MRERKRARLEAEIQRLLAEILEFKLKDPVVRAAFPTVTRVRLSPNGRVAKVHVSLAGGPGGKIMAAFARDRGFLRTQLAKILAVRRVPDLVFEIEEDVRLSPPSPIAPYGEEPTDDPPQ